MSVGGAWRYSAAVTVVVALAPWAAAAQQSDAPAGQPGERMQVVELVGSVTYDSNVAGTNAALATARRISPSDVIFQPTVRFQLARPIGRQTVFLTGDIGYDFHARNSTLNRENLDIRPAVLGQVGICQTGLNGEYSRAQSNLYELARSPVGPSNLSQEKNVLQVEQVGGDATCGGASGFAPSVTASEIWTQNSSVTQRFVDAQTFSGSAGVTYRRPTLGALRLFAAYSESTFPNRAGLAQILGVPVSTGYTTLSGGVTYTRAVGSRLQGSVSLSYTTLNSQGAGSGGFTGPTYSAALNYQVSSRLNVTGQVSRATVPSTRLNSTFSIDEIYLGQVSYELGTRLTLHGGASFGHDSYSAEPHVLAFDLTDQKIYTIFGDVELQLTRRLAFKLNLEQRQLNANFAGLSYPDTRVGLTVRATF